MSTSTEVSDDQSTVPTTENISHGSSQNCAIVSSATSEVEQPSSKMVENNNCTCPIASLGGVIGLLVGHAPRTCYWIDCNLLCVGETQVTETAS